MYPKDCVICSGVIFALVMLMLFFCAQARSEQALSFGWDPSPDPNVAGYYISYGTAPGSYYTQVDVGSNTTATLSKFVEGVNYYLVVVAYNAQHLPSAESSELFVTIPGRLFITPGARSSDPITLSFPIAPGHWYELQSATTLGSWHTLWRTWVSTDYETAKYEDYSDTGVPQCFYRLVMH